MLCKVLWKTRRGRIFNEQAELNSNNSIWPSPDYQCYHCFMVCLGFSFFFFFFLPLASSNSTEYEFQAVISVSNLEQFQSILNTLSFPLLINATGEITSINTTTGKTSIYVASPLLANLIHSKCHIEPLCCVLLSVFTKHNCKHNWIPVHMWGELCLVI